MGTEAAWVPYVIAAIGAGASAYNTNQTNRRQDNQAATAIQNQGRVQRRVDDRVAQEVQQLEQSSATDERAKALEGYMGTLARNRKALESGLAPSIGSGAFRDASTTAAGDVQGYAARTADLMSRIDAPAMQRQGEGFGYGRLATDLGTLSRQASGQAFLDEMRMRSIRRNPWIDAAAGAISAYGGSQMGARADKTAYTGDATNPIYNTSGIGGGDSILNGYGTRVRGYGPNYGY